MDKLILFVVKILAIIVGIFTIIGLAAIINLKEYMQERDKKHEQWIDPRNDKAH